jgi:outer membrane protein assembly factor BamB
MKRVTILSVLACIQVVLQGGVVQAQQANWPTWRGPEFNGLAPAGNPPVTWSETKNIKWKVAVPGSSTSSPIVWADKIYFLTAVPNQSAAISDSNVFASPQVQPRSRGRGRSGGRGGGRMSRSPSAIHKFNLVCLDRNSGKLLWQKTAKEELPHQGHHPDHGFASYSPVTDGKHIWASFGSRGMYCFDMTGNLKWSKDLIKMETRAGFGEGSSPGLAGDAVIVVTDHEGDSHIFAFHKLTGDLLWKKARDERTSWATPVAVEVNGKLQVITNGTTFIRSYDAKTGDLIWQCTGQTDNVVPSPVLGFGKVYCASGFRGNALQAITLGKTGDLSGTDAIAWQIREATPYVPSPLLYGDNIYFGYGNRATISCYQAETGKANYAKQSLEEMSGLYASPVGVANRVYFAGRGGVTTVIKNSAKFEVLAINKLDDGFDASPAIVGDEILLKGRKYLYCIANL